MLHFFLAKCDSDNECDSKLCRNKICGKNIVVQWFLSSFIDRISLYLFNFCNIRSYIYILESSFELVGIGWCRPDGCNVEKDKNCRVDGFFKDNVDFDECITSCLQEPTCTGIGYSNDQHGSVPNRCFVHGNTSSTNRFSEWYKFSRSQETLPTTSSGLENSKCWSRKGINSSIL